MSTIKKKKITSKLPVEMYANTETGETLASELGKTISISVKQDTDQFIINYDNFVTFQDSAMYYIANVLTKSEVSLVFTMSRMLKTDCCILSQENNHPHNSETLQCELNLELSKFYALVRKLVKKGILAYCVCAPSGYVQKIYMLNPHIAKKRVTVNCALDVFFKDIPKLQD